MWGAREVACRRLAELLLDESFGHRSRSVCACRQHYIAPAEKKPRIGDDAGLRKAASVHDHACEDISLEHDQNAHEASECDRMLEHKPQDRALVPEPVGGR